MTKRLLIKLLNHDQRELMGKDPIQPFTLVDSEQGMLIPKKEPAKEPQGFVGKHIASETRFHSFTMLNDASMIS